jgi:sodium transport system permease protein
MSWKNIRLVFLREVRDQLRDRRTLFMITILPVLLYPMMGMGIVQMLLTFSEQQRAFVVLNADQLPEAPPLLETTRIRPEWFDAGTEDTAKLRVLTEANAVTDDDKATQRRTRRGRKSDTELLKSARSLEAKLHTINGLARTPDNAPTFIALQQELNEEFAASGIQVLMIVPTGYGKAFQEMRTSLAERSAELHPGDPIFDVPELVVVRNSADDKSASAFGRVQRALRTWEDVLRRQCFEQANLPLELQQPARFRWVEVAQKEQVSASVWSKLFPALLVIMALTGAFYPAIDLGAGEKERGTMETLLISPAKRIELVLGKFATIMLFSVATAVLNLASMGITGQQMASVLGDGVSSQVVSLEFPGARSLLWLVVLLIPLAALFSALCLALATFARSTKEGQYYLTPLLMVVMGLTMFCLSPAIEMTPIYSVTPVVNVALLLKGLLLNSASSGNLAYYAVPVLVSSIGYSVLALWWAIELYNSENVLFREAEKFDLRDWFKQLLRSKDAVPVFPEAVFCFVLILLLQFVAMAYMKPDLTTGDPGRTMMRLIVVQQLTMVACPAVFMGILLTTSLRATFRLRKPTLLAMGFGAGLAILLHPLSVELSQFLVEHQVFPELPDSAKHVMALMRTGDRPLWLLMMVFAVTPAICEELAFRGFILSGLARGGRLPLAIGISSLMFGIIHMIPQQAFNAALLGLVLGLLAVYSRSLFPAMAFHFCNNAIATLHAGEQGRLATDGVFLSRDAEGFLRYESPLLILCGLACALIILHMIKTLIHEQDSKRRGLIPDYRDQHSSLTTSDLASTV